MIENQENAVIDLETDVQQAQIRVGILPDFIISSLELFEFSYCCRSSMSWMKRKIE
jgi:hypothetical protein